MGRYADAEADIGSMPALVVLFVLLAVVVGVIRAFRGLRQDSGATGVLGWFAAAAAQVAAIYLLASGTSHALAFLCMIAGTILGAALIATGMQRKPSLRIPASPAENRRHARQDS